MEDIAHVKGKGEKDYTLSIMNKNIRQYNYVTVLNTGSTIKAGCFL